MRIAYISYEFPPLTSYGGIGTYVYQVTKMLAERRHDVEVFAPAFDTNTSTYENGVLVHRIKSDRSNFAIAIVDKFKERNKAAKFDIIESPEYGADGMEVFKNFPDIPKVVKAHTPNFIFDEINPPPAPDLISKIKIIVGALRRGKLPFLQNAAYQKEADKEYQISKLADCVTTPSKSLGEILKSTWGLEEENILVQPNPYIPTKELLDIPIVESNDKNITFIGRLEIRKGMIVLIEAINKILKKDPDVIFHFVGKPMHSPKPDTNMEEYIKLQVKSSFHKNLKFYGRLQLPEIAAILKSTSVCIIPSIWENFPNVCLEAMSAGRAVVGTFSGGMAEMLSDEAGMLIPPNNPHAIAAAIFDLLSHPELRVVLGKKARERVLSEYNAEKLGLLIELQFGNIIDGITAKPVSKSLVIVN